jgi:DNA-binding MarR family transcriptional regulator
MNFAQQLIAANKPVSKVLKREEQRACSEKNRENTLSRYRAAAVCLGGVVTSQSLAEKMKLDSGRVATALKQYQQEGFVEKLNTKAPYYWRFI